MALSIIIQCALSFLSGVVSHRLIFIHGELDDFSVWIASSFLFLWALLIVASTIAYETIFIGTLIGTLLFILYLFGIASSIATYRLFFHPLRQFAGRRTYVLTQWRTALDQYRTNRYFANLWQQHATYGDYVRTGPNHLSVRNLDAIRAIYSDYSICSRGPWYDLGGRKFILGRTRDRQSYIQERVFWRNGLSGNVLDSYADRMKEETQRLLLRLPSEAGVVDMTDELSFHAFNVMSSIVFSRTYEEGRRDEVLRILRLLEDTQQLLGIISPVPWAWSLLAHVPGGLRSAPDFYRTSKQLLNDRLQRPPSIPDLITALQAAQNDPSAPGFPLPEESRLALTSSQFNSNAVLPILYQLATNPAYLNALHDDIADDVRSGQFDIRKASPQLDSIIKESIRLMPPIANGAQRKTPPLGLRIGETYIPGNVVVKVPLYSILRDERYFAYPDSFMPERWTTRSELVKESEAFIPFLTGTYACIGQELAMMHSRAVVAQMVTAFQISLAGDGGIGFEASGKDYYLMYYGSLKLRLVRREKNIRV